MLNSRCATVQSPLLTDRSFFRTRIRPLWLLLQPKTSSIIIITSTQHITDGSTPPSEERAGPLISTRLTYRGEFIDRCFFPLADKYKSMELWGMFQLAQTSHRGCFAVKTMCEFDGKCGLDHDIICLELDEHFNQFMIMDAQPELSANLSWWNDTFCHGQLRTGTGPAERGLNTTVANTSGFSRNLVTYDGLDYDLGYPGKYHATLINEKYIVHSLHTDLAVFCFDENADGEERDGYEFDEGEVFYLDFEREALKRR